MFTMITCHRRRGREAMNFAGILPAFTGIAVHDAWAPYDTYPQVTHALWNAHVLRELIAVTDHHAQSPDPTSWCWAAQVIDNLLTIKTMTQDGSLEPGHLAACREILVHAARIGTAAPTPGPVGAEHRALPRRITSRIEDDLRFAIDPRSPRDNNAAEHEIRMAKLRQKVSGGMRALVGAQHFAALRSYLATTAKHGIDGLEALIALITGNPWLRQEHLNSYGCTTWSTPMCKCRDRPGPWPRNITARRRPRRSAPGSSPWPPGSRAPPASSGSTYPRAWPWE